MGEIDFMKIFELIPMVNYCRESEIFIEYPHLYDDNYVIFEKITKIKKRYCSAAALRCRKRKFKLIQNNKFKFDYIKLVNLINILNKIYQEKPLFFKRNIKLIVHYLPKYIGFSDPFYVLRLTETLWSYIKQKYDYRSSYIDFLFSETLDEKERKEKELTNWVKKLINEEVTL